MEENMNNALRPPSIPCRTSSRSASSPVTPIHSREPNESVGAIKEVPSHVPKGSLTLQVAKPAHIEDGPFESQLIFFRPFETCTTIHTLSDLNQMEITLPKIQPQNSESELGDLENALPLPPKKLPFLLRHARHNFGNVYRRLFSTVFVPNLAAFIYLVSSTSDWARNPPLSAFATASAANIFVAILIRQDYIINSLYRSAWLIPQRAPLRVRRIIAKVYEYGGVHSGTAVCATLWFISFTGVVTHQFVIGNMKDPAILSLTYILVTLLCGILVTAYPRFRFKLHNMFEVIHRWAGWCVLSLFWLEVIFFARSQVQPGIGGLKMVLLKTPAFWLLVPSTFHIFFPWRRLHKLNVQPERLSAHAIRLHFTEPVPKFCGLRISNSPLTEWHSFACIPNRDGGRSGGSLIISNAGDWTKHVIENPQSYYWVKGVPLTGMLCIARIFRRVIIVTTGSGIGPCLGVMQDIPETFCRVLWSAPAPYVTYGAEIVNAVKSVDSYAKIIDTKLSGRLDLAQLAWELYESENAEAVFVISNPNLTKKIVYTMESRGIPAFGPIWDS